MSDAGSSVTLILYSLDSDWWKTGREPLLNIVAAAAQRSTFTQVELAIGEDAGLRGEMINVLRIFNDNTGVELAQRTGKNPNYQYIQLGCSKAAERAMLAWSHKQIGKPFSSVGMIRSIVWPRNTDSTSFFGAERVAACLKVGGLMSRDSNPGNATPASLHALYKSRGAVQANPYTLRREFPIGSDSRYNNQHPTDPQYLRGGLVGVKRFPITHGAAAESMLNFSFSNALNNELDPRQIPQGVERTTAASRRSKTPPKQRLVLINGNKERSIPSSGLSISLNSLDMTICRNA